MTHCPHCKHEFEYNHLLPLGWRFKIGVRCQKCHETSYHAASSKKKIMLSVFIYPLLLVIFQAMGLALGWSALIGLCLLAGTLFLIPFLVRLSPEEEPLW
ncbi:hypothetical protein E3U55_14995 [Filobacillus milosensis]|uniref:CXXC-20-CXXC protein n=1 Tax=Filobacillus milosensis TaxID=94137 RepID=A0A4Y8IG68_9BACI|nr:TIGR04104 family putative zinc finger protein [Filobacillus milosensis]TFB14084.1 hypothetical protein E3U55_14995 [Filobacillus milosensis]